MTYVSATLLTAVLPASNVATSGTHAITVATPGGGTSAAATLTVTAAPATPTITSISPTSVLAGRRTGDRNGDRQQLRRDVGCAGGRRRATDDLRLSDTTNLSVGSERCGDDRDARHHSDDPRARRRDVAGRHSDSDAKRVPDLDRECDVGGAGRGGDDDAQQRSGRRAGLARAGSERRPQHQLSDLRVCRGGRDDTHVDRVDADDVGHVEFRLFADDGYVRLATSPTVTVANGNPIPAVTSVAPASVVAGSAAFALTVAGSGFVNGSVVQVDGSNRTTTFASATQLTATILASDVVAAGTHTITRFSPTPGGGTSSGATLTVTAPYPAPTLTSVAPASVVAGSAAFTRPSQARDS